MSTGNRWVLLKHINAPDDQKKIHFDLLIEDRNACRTWKLLEIPVLDGKKVEAIHSPLHKLQWLEKKEAQVSGGRGWASRIESGVFIGQLPIERLDELSVQLQSKTICGYIVIKSGFCKIFSQKSKIDNFNLSFS
ncbi:hypothetical protein [Prochlorococcus sp. MIT 1223]|uniref:hypothetical protein n=1 Tax=Prochlorococcus sp. MIT 1223 TaxID=3096217 RepID=UPI002A748586|nr:hypothetical protein [Prochlorococcus sp. MIT 1223]